ncbi:MAG: hypothetical protein DI533_09245 [Cereibacter sphaeroides]|uniref:Extensin-like C-terminal domain-containing protein n=1 Tax=Cereibacter sphaeroides TaxID=1063 RepID=A0A2W5SIQ9_CERSP|nr:MAG: hypothetical protein DI533_09245 [Cereibacter sphaeroides]
MRTAGWAIALAIGFVFPAWADAPSSSLRPPLRPAAADAPVDADALIQTSLATAPANPLRPLPRPTIAVLEQPVIVAEQPISAGAQATAGPEVSLRPRARRLLAAALVEPPAQPVILQSQRFALVVATRPEPRPPLRADAPLERVESVAAIRILPGKSAVFGRKGSVCGVPAIKGQELGAITSRVKGCGIEDPVKVTSVSGVTLSTPATIDCTTAKALNTWVSDALQPSFKNKQVVGLQIAGSYSCRPRNNVRGAKISEHGRGRAVDIAAINLADGTSVVVEKDWRRSAGRPMKVAYGKACGTFGTTLSPDSDRFHQDHMHFDTARGRSGPYCR